MKAVASSGELDYQWAPVTAISGIAGGIAYAFIGIASHSTSNIIVVPLSFAFAFGITVGSIGLYHILGGPRGSRLALIAAVANVIAAAQLLAMIMVQQSVWATVDQPDAALRAVWWGLDVAWDLYLGTGTILFALSMFRRRGLGAWLAVPGLLISGPFLIFNIATFPQPPDVAGLVDLGPVVGLWYLAVFVRLGASAVLLGRRKRRSTAALEGAAGPDWAG
ncbi:MAG TPA: hypothetical protein VE136_05655 [Anaerolineales bacterium]|nr:hypothetical protein [Anaerolineales bacterium]